MGIFGGALLTMGWDSPGFSIGNCHGIFGVFSGMGMNRLCFPLRRIPLSRVASELIFHIYYTYLLNFFFERDIYRLCLDKSIL